METLEKSERPRQGIAISGARQLHGRRIMKASVKLVVVSLVLGLASTQIACGGGAGSAKVSSANVEQSPMEELESIPKDIEKDIADLQKPIDEAQQVADEIGNLPKKHHISAGDMAAMSKATFDNGKVEVKINGDVSAEAKAEVEATLKKLAHVVAELKATPAKVAALTEKLVKSTAKVPVLAAKVTSGATLTATNPFGSADSKAKANAEIAGVGKVQADVSKAIGDAQSKVTSIPGMATGALTKLGASFTSMN